MSLAMRDGDRLHAVALSPMPVHFKGFAVVYCHYYLRRGEVPALDRARSAVSERDRPDIQMFVECEPAGWFARGKVDQIMPQVLAPDRSHATSPLVTYTVLYSIKTIEYPASRYHYAFSKPKRSF